MTSVRNDVFIQFYYNEREIDGIDSFKAIIENHYLCQGIRKSIPAYSEGGEIWFNLIINSDFFDFAKDVVVGGLTWDLLKKGTKKYFFKPFFEALKKLEESNRDSFKLKIDSIKFQFDDIEIIIGGIESHRIAVVSLIFNEIAKSKEKMERQIKLPISKIETPILYNPSIDKKGYSPYILLTKHGLPIKDYLRMWKIWFMSNRRCKILKLAEMEYLEAFPN